VFLQLKVTPCVVRVIGPATFGVCEPSGLPLVCGYPAKQALDLPEGENR
jgi:hypothetical protein